MRKIFLFKIPGQSARMRGFSSRFLDNQLEKSGGGLYFLSRATCLIHLLEESLVFGYGEVEREEARSEGRAEGVAVHECYLSADRLVFEEVLAWGYHVR